MIGRTVGRFRVLAPLGQGGMATVWRARDEMLGREVALKILAESLAQSPDARRRFRHEAGIAARLDHPGIAAVYDSGESADLTWIAMALIDGETLAERVRKSLLPIEAAVNAGIVVAEALDYAHAQGVVHRDVSARNVMLARDGRVFVLDFGLALAQGASRISSSGTTVGTAPYMAPEVLLGGTADARSDLYALGVVLYEALTGSLPFESGSPAVSVFAALHRTIRPPRELRPEIGVDLDCIVQRCLSRDRLQRYESAREVATALRATLQREAAPAPAVPSATPPPTTPRAPSVSAERLAAAAGPVYLAVPVFECLDHDADSAAQSIEIGRSLTVAARVGLSQLERLHVVPVEASPATHSNEGLREFARSAGANLLLLGAVRRATTRVRVSYAVVDPEAGLQVAGDSIEGSALDLFELEDRMVASLRRALSRAGARDGGDERKRAPDPAAGERLHQAVRYLERHDHEASVDGAIGILERLIESEGERAEYQALLGRAFLCKYRLTQQRAWSGKAAAACERASLQDPSSPEVLLSLGDLHESGGRHSQALDFYRRVLMTQPGRYEAHLGAAQALEALGRSEEAEAACQNAIQLRESDWRAYNLLGIQCFSHARYERAAHCWEQVLRLTPDNAIGARNLGSAFYHLDRLEDSISAYRKSLHIQPNAMAFTNLGTVLFYLRRYPEAAESFEKSTALRPADPLMWGNLGNAYCLIPGGEARGREALERAIGLMRERLDRESGTAEAWSRFAEWHSVLGRHSEASAAIARALEIDSDDVHALVRAAWVHLKCGDADRAMERLRDAIGGGYSIEELQRHPELDALRGRDDFQQLLDQASRGPSEGRSPPQ